MMAVELPALPETVQSAVAPDWNTENLDKRPCPACGEDRPRPFVTRPDKLVVSACEACGMLYLALVPAPPEIEKFYRGYDDFKCFKPQPAISRWTLFKLSRQDRRIRILEATGGLCGKDLVEIGCAYGSFLRLCRYKGARVSGVELDEKARGLLTAAGFKVGAALEGESKHDVVCAFNLFEHPVDVSAMIADIARTLRPDGRLIFSVPNAGQVETTGPTWIGFRVDLEHLNYFSLKTMAGLLARHRLIIENYWENLQPALGRGPAPMPGILSRLASRAFDLAGIGGESVSTVGSYHLTAVARKY